MKTPSEKLKKLQEAERDETLVALFKAGDVSAFDEIARLYRPNIRDIARGVLNNYADAEDVAQDTLIKVYEKLSGFRGESSLATWIFKIAFNKARNRLRLLKCRRRHATISINEPLGRGFEALGEAVCSTDKDPRRKIADKEFEAMVRASVAKLDSKKREVFVLCCLLNRSYEEVASSSGIDVGTVKSRVNRARTRLKELLDKECAEFMEGKERPSSLLIGETERDCSLIARA